MTVRTAFRMFAEELFKGRAIPVDSGGDKIKVKVPVIQDLSTPPSPSEVPVASYTRAYLGPGSPFTPFGAYINQNDESGQRGVMRENEPRSFQYMPNSNIVITPRIGYGLMSFAELKMLSEAVPEVSMCVRLLTEEMKGFIPTIKRDGKVVTDEDKNYNRMRWTVERPDRYAPMGVWLPRYMRNLLVYDAPAVYKVRDNGGEEITGARVVDGSTLVRLIDERAEPPEPPAPAFTQIIQGTPLQWFDTNQVWYQCRQPRIDAPYGTSPIEDALQAVITLQRFWAAQVAWYTEGNIPELVFTAPPNYTEIQCLDLERALNERMVGAVQERARARVMPSGTSVLTTKDAHFDADVYAGAANAVRLAFGIVQSEVGEAPGEGLGGKGYAEAMASNFYRMALAPNISHVEGFFQDVYANNGWSDAGYAWSLEFPADTIDPEKMEEKHLNRFERGLARRDESRGALAMEPLGGEEGKYLVNPGSGPDQGMDGMGGGLDDLPSKVDVTGDSGSTPGHFESRIPVGSGGKIQMRSDHKIKVKQGSHGKIRIIKAVEATLPEQHTGAMVALYLPDETVDILAAYINGKDWPEGAVLQQPYDLHLTLAYLGETDDMEGGLNRDQLSLLVDQFAAGHAPISGSINGVGRFLDTHKDGQHCIYANIDAPGLSGMRTELVEFLKKNDWPVQEDHGFTPHVTLCYIPATSDTPDITDFQVIQVNAVEIGCAWAEDVIYHQLSGPLEKVVEPVFLEKHCGVCAEDDSYFGVRVVKDSTVDNPHQGANKSEIVSMSASGMEARAGIFKPFDGENEGLQGRIGGFQGYRDEAMYLLDRAWNDPDHYLVPVTYVTSVDGHEGVVSMYVKGRKEARDPEEYDPDYTWRAAVEDYIGGQTDRHSGNWLTHPDDDKRLVMPDGGLSFPDKDRPVGSPFVALWQGKELPGDAKDATFSLLGNKAFWRDLSVCVGKDAAALAMGRAKKLYEDGVIPEGHDVREKSTILVDKTDASEGTDTETNKDSDSEKT